MVGRIGSHMVLWSLPWDLAVRLWGQSLHDLDWESCSGVHRVWGTGCAKTLVILCVALSLALVALGSSDLLMCFIFEP
jgi:hypothetical protein